MEREIITRAEAKALGLKTYFTGQPCNRGGIGERLVSNRRCVCDKCRAKKLEDDIRYQDKNKEKFVEYQKKYALENREKIASSRKARRDANRDADIARKREYRAANPDKAKEYYRLNADTVKKNSARWQTENRGRVRQLHSAWGKANRHKRNMSESFRRSAKKDRVPCWFGEFDRLVLEEAFRLKDMRDRMTGFRWNVDHMIPLQAKDASGLHCGDNLQVIPERLNFRKGNSMALTNRGEWIDRL